MQYTNTWAQRQSMDPQKENKVRQSVIELAREHARRGHSITSTSRLLGLYPWQLRKLLGTAGVDDIQFANGRQSLASKNALAALHASRRGRPQPNQSPEVYAALARGRETTRNKYLRSAFGVSGTVKELKIHFGCKLTLNGLYQRLRRGMTIEEALTMEAREREPLDRTIICKEKVIELARGYAKRGHSFTFTAQLLGISNKRLRRLLDQEATDIQFVRGTESLAFRKRLEELHESQRGQRQRYTNPACLAALARGREKRCTRYTAFGVTGYLSELKEHFNCPIQVKSIRARIARGMSVEDALTIPVREQRKGLYPPQFYDWLIKRRTMASAEILMIARNRLTPTMLQYSEPDHDIVVTSRIDACITVEVRTHIGEVLHRLRFIKSFESGVLFVFNPQAQGRIKFIAFEPDSKALHEVRP